MSEQSLRQRRDCETWNWISPETTGSGSGSRQNHHSRWGSAALNFYRWFKIEQDGQISNGTVTETVKNETGMG